MVRFRTYTFPESTMDHTVNQLDQTELEDEAVVESEKEDENKTSDTIS